MNDPCCRAHQRQSAAPVTGHCSQGAVGEAWPDSTVGSTTQQAHTAAWLPRAGRWPAAAAGLRPPHFLPFLLACFIFSRPAVCKYDRFRGAEGRGVTRGCGIWHVRHCSIQRLRAITDFLVTAARQATTTSTSTGGQPSLPASLLMPRLVPRPPVLLLPWLFEQCFPT